MTIQSTGNNGLLWRALAISLAAHALLLSPSLPPQVAERAGAALQATLRPFAAAKPAPAAGGAPADQTRAVAVAPPPVRGGGSPAPTFAAQQAAVMAAPAQKAASAAAPERAGAVPAVAGAGLVDAVATRAADAGGAGATGAAEAGAKGPDPDGLRQYRLTLAREARRFKRYPELARTAGLGGTAEVRVEQEASGLPVVRLAHSSGNAALDAAALEMMRQATPRAVLPETLRGRAFGVSLPVVFDLDAD